MREVLREINGLTLGKEEVLVMLYNLQSYEMKLPAYLESKKYVRNHMCVLVFRIGC